MKSNEIIVNIIFQFCQLIFSPSFEEAHVIIFTSCFILLLIRFSIVWKFYFWNMGAKCANFNAIVFNTWLVHIRTSINSCGKIHFHFFSKAFKWHKTLSCWVIYILSWLFDGYWPALCCEMTVLELVQPIYQWPEFRCCQYILNSLSPFLLICCGRLLNSLVQRNSGLEEGSISWVRGQTMCCLINGIVWIASLKSLSVQLVG